MGGRGRGAIIKHLSRLGRAVFGGHRPEEQGQRLHGIMARGTSRHQGQPGCGPASPGNKRGRRRLGRSEQSCQQQIRRDIGFFLSKTIIRRALVGAHSNCHLSHLVLPSLSSPSSSSSEETLPDRHSPRRPPLDVTLRSGGPQCHRVRGFTDDRLAPFPESGTPWGQRASLSVCIDRASRQRDLTWSRHSQQGELIVYGCP